MLKVKLGVPEKWIPITLGSDGDFEILVRRPSYQQLTEALTAENRPDYRIRSSVVDWRGLTDAEDKPIPFSQPALQGVCEAYPQSLFAILDAVNRAFQGFPEADAKN